MSDATRFLCVGAHLDEPFSKLVVKELFGQALRAVAPSYGFDVRPVALHCLAARQRRRIRDLILAVVGIAMLLVGAVPTVTIGLVWWVLGWLFGALRNGPHGLRQAIDRVSLRSVLFVVVVSWLALFAAAIWASLATFVRLLIDQASITPGAGAQAAIPPAQSAIVSPVGFLVGLFLSGLLIVVGWTVLYIVVLTELVARRGRVVRELRQQAFRARPEPGVRLSRRLQDRLDRVSKGQLRNATVYSGFDPFVGTGEVLPGWSFAMSLRADPHSDRQFKTFSVVDLVDHVRERITEIAAHEDDANQRGPEGENPLPGLVVFDHVFVSTGAIRRDVRFLPNPAVTPRTHLSPPEVEEIAGAPRGAVRHYLSTYVRSWSGEIVPFTFFHFSTDGDKLYFECVRRVLLPVRAGYHRVDTMTAQMSGGEFVRVAADAAARTVGATVGAPGRLISELLFDLRADSPPSDTIIDYGARMSVREEGASEVFLNYFQNLDMDKHLKIVERQVLGSIAEFLVERGVDTAEFVERQVWILNQTTSNITVTGDNNTIGPVATGRDANASHSAGTAAAGPTGQATQGGSGL